MITEPTVLILGAGASLDYGFPLGRGLRDLVCGITATEASSVIEQAGYSIEELNEFVDTLKHSGFTSVDWFLEDRPEFVLIGKAAIAAALIPFENPEKLFPPGAPPNHWYELLLNVLDRPLGAFPENKLSVITFNYDRSIEHYMFTTLTTRTGSEQRAIELMDKFEIVHVHGALGNLEPLHPTGRLYQPMLDSDAIRVAADQLIIVGEASGETSEFERARSLLSNARRIVFLGFGYHSESVRRLGVFNEPWDEEMRQRVRVGGTSRSIPLHAWNHIQANVLNQAFPARNRKVDPVYRYLSEAEPLDDYAL